ncbi:MAG: YcxB family protein [Pyrinomonadaceae bacterium]
MQHHQATKLRRGVVLMMKIFSIVLLSFIGVVLLAWIQLPSKSAPPWSLLLLIIFCFYLLMFDRVNAWAWGRRFGKRPDADMEIEWKFSKKGIKTQSDLGEATLQWKGFLKVVEASDGFLFYPLEKLFHWMPFSAFESPECVDRVRTFVTENNVTLIQRRSNKALQLTAPFRPA